jgi:Cu/Ag efflux pump CusA
VRFAAVCVLLAACHKHAPVERETGPVVVLAAEDPGLNAADMEREIAIPLETAINGVAHLANTRTTVVPGLATIGVELAPGADLLAARRDLFERTEHAQLPDGVHAELARDSRRGATLRYVLSGTDRVALRTVQDGTVARALLRVPGVAEVATCGGREQRLDVAAVPAKVMQFSATAADLIAPLSAAIQQGITVADAPEKLAAVQVTSSEYPFRVGDVAHVMTGEGPRTCDAFDETGAEVVVGTVYATSGADELDVRKRLEAALAAQTLPVNVDLYMWPRAKPAALGVDVNDVADLVAVRGTAPMIVEYGPAAGAPPLAPGIASVHVSVEDAPGLVTRLWAAHLLVHQEDEVVVQLRGGDPSTLEKWAHEVEVRLGSHANGRIGTRYAPSLNVVPDRARLERLGVTADAITDAVRVASGGYILGSAYTDARATPIALTMGSLTFDQLPYIHAGKAIVPLTEVATLTQTSEPADIHREDGMRWVGVRAIGEPDDVQAALADLVLPPGYYWQLIAAQ